MLETQRSQTALTGRTDSYRTLYRRIVSLIAVVTILPLLALAGINYYEYQARLSQKIQEPLRSLVGKTQHSFELFLAERASALSFIAAGYPFEYLATDAGLQKVFQVMRKEFSGFIDISVIDSEGTTLSYIGPYKIKNKNHANQEWFKHILLTDIYISDVFLGFRKIPHIVVAIRHNKPSGHFWILRATLDTKQFDAIINSMGLKAGSDAFLVNQVQVLQTHSRHYGEVLSKLPLALPPARHEANITTVATPQGENFLALAKIANTDLSLVGMVPKPTGKNDWYIVRADLLIIFLTGVIAIFATVITITRSFLKRLQNSDEQRLRAIQHLEHAQKLSSIGRLATGVAHEINNPLAIINEKTGLMQDLIELQGDFPEQERFKGLIDAILHSVERCRNITHRMLGFARRIEVKIELLDINKTLEETLGFLEKEALYRNIAVKTDFDTNLPKIPTDYGQVQQVFLNILNNALAAVPDGGQIRLSSRNHDNDFITVAIADNGCGMSEETCKQMFEPFFSTKKEKGTGLGMSITHSIINRLGGKIEVDSAIGQGTTMTVFLPKTINNANKTDATTT